MTTKHDPKINLGYLLSTSLPKSIFAHSGAKTIKFILIIFLLTILALGGWFGFKFYQLSKKIIVKNTQESAPSLIKGIGSLDDIKPRDLRGEGDSRINILLLGVGGPGHDGPYLTDSIMIASINPRDLSVALLSIPRDLFVPVKNFGSLKVNSIYTTGEDAGITGGGAELLKQTLADVFDIPIHYYALLDFNGFTKAIDAIGGINISVPEDLYDPLYPAKNDDGYDPFSIKKGSYLMAGELALKYARSRETTSDFDRAKRQQMIMMAARKKILSGSTLFSLDKISNLMEIMGSSLKTNIQLWEAERLYEIVSKIDDAKISTKVLDDGPDGLLYGDMVNGMYILSPSGGNFNRIKQFIHQFFEDPYLAKEFARIEILNGTPNEGSASVLAQELRLLGYNVSRVGNFSSQNEQATRIIDLSGGRVPFTIQYLENRLGVKIAETAEQTDIFDIQIIIGADYTP